MSDREDREVEPGGSQQDRRPQSAMVKANARERQRTHAGTKFMSPTIWRDKRLGVMENENLEFTDGSGSQSGKLRVMFVSQVCSHPEWQWFREQMHLLPPTLRQHSAGIVPFNGLLLSHRALLAIVDADPPPGIFCELRIGTLLRSAGSAIGRIPARQATDEFVSSA